MVTWLFSMRNKQDWLYIYSLAGQPLLDYYIYHCEVGMLHKDKLDTLKVTLHNINS